MTLDLSEKTGDQKKREKKQKEKQKKTKTKKKQKKNKTAKSPPYQLALNRRWVASAKRPSNTDERHTFRRGCIAGCEERRDLPSSVKWRIRRKFHYYVASDRRFVIVNDDAGWSNAGPSWCQFADERSASNPGHGVDVIPGFPTAAGTVLFVLEKRLSGIRQIRQAADRRDDPTHRHADRRMEIRDRMRVRRTTKLERERIIRRCVWSESWWLWPKNKAI